MKITQTRLKEIIQEELASVAAEGLSPDAMEERTPMMPPRESAIAATVGSIINGLRSGKLSAQGAADRLESEVKDKLYKLRLEEGELEESDFEDGDRRWREQELAQIKAAQAKTAAEREARRKRMQGGGSGYKRADGTYISSRE